MGGVENPRRRGEKNRGNKWKLFSKIIEHLRLAPIWPGDEDIVIWWENVDTLFLHLEFYRCVLIAFVVFVVGPVAILADVPGDVEPVATALRLELGDVDHEEDEEEEEDIDEKGVRSPQSLLLSTRRDVRLEPQYTWSGRV